VIAGAPVGCSEAGAGHSGGAAVRGVLERLRGPGGRVAELRRLNGLGRGAAVAAMARGVQAEAQAVGLLHVAAQVEGGGRGVGNRVQRCRRVQSGKRIQG
jgi:hypothetical protein